MFQLNDTPKLVHRSTEGERERVKAFSGRKIALHNHPTNICPTGSDFATAAARKYDIGIVITHDLRVFVYTPPTEIVHPEVIDAIIEKYTRGKVF